MKNGAVPRRTFLWATSAMAGIGALTGLTRPAAGQEKVSQAAAKYQSGPKGQQRCEICVNFRPPNECAFVVGPISPNGWCQFFAAKENAQ